MTSADWEAFYEKHDTCPQKAATAVIDEWYRPNDTPVSTITGSHPTTAVSTSTLISALEAITGDCAYDDPGGWGELIDDAVQRHEIVSEDSISTQLSGLESVVAATPVAERPKSKVCLFITDILMAQNGTEFVAGVDTYNGTTA